MAIVRIDRGQFAQQLTVEMAAVGQLGEVQQSCSRLSFSRAGRVSWEGTATSIASPLRSALSSSSAVAKVWYSTRMPVSFWKGPEHLRVDVGRSMPDAQGLPGLG